MKRLLTLLSPILLLTSCFDTFELRETIDNYYLLAIDLPDNMTLCYSDEGGPSYSRIIPPTIFECEWNERYILAKAYPKELKQFVTDGLRDNYLFELESNQEKFKIADSLAQKRYTELYLDGTLTKSDFVAYYLLDTKGQNQKARFFYSNDSLRSYIEQAKVGLFESRAYYETLAKKLE